MPELDGTSLISLASFGLLIIGWMIAPSEKTVRVRASHAPLVEPVAA